MASFKIVIVSDSIGETGEFVARAGLSQFNFEIDEKIITRYPHIKEKEDFDFVIRQHQNDNVIIVYTIIQPVLRKYVDSVLEENGITHVDIMGPIMTAIESKTEVTPFYEPGRVHILDEDYFKKIDAIEFAVKYDDGKDPSGLLKADIVLLGVSRTSKTPLSQYFAHKGYRVVNVPLVPEVSAPKELFEIDSNKIIGLKIDSEPLYRIRKERLSQLGLLDSANYGKSERILEELDYFDEIVGKLGCQTINVSNKAIEESANEIMKLLDI
ncbi:pyruvate, water dikinase regulatory protein [Phocicoccus pinnipedialis]|uniref:Putative pyruvate, phosphate dikinase regulatory protein n=1 Tax=Phocicoccus pinnipedialis TaxID=110845 RepID=A0A6V7RF38_9BACL|nr:pyruvate, water dikinase regulatory protein [Jeotgalicoccus pinnipedialis]MBP1939275.1 regulator of PEP synthase PpsR (kinase-PPPase family) [Jeotgalicoccus pinnipedialis]CAD2076064.1 Putative pyruvate, phosphate dikinase regulatory protein [Jeotgalicoccus pinnipedialis]